MLEFKDGQNNVLSGTVNVGFSTKVDLVLTVKTTGVVGDIKGTIVKNGGVIGDFSRVGNNTPEVVWYAGSGSNLYINKGDVIEAIRTEPTPFTETLIIDSLYPMLEGKTSLASIVRQIRSIAPESRPNDILKDSIDRINDELKPIKYTNKTPVNVMGLKTLMSEQVTLPPIEANIYGSTEALDQALDDFIPPTPRDIFDTWHRISSDFFYPNGVGATGNANGWYWDDNLNSPVQPVNDTTYMLGFVSIEELENYKHEVTLKSDASDDDENGVIAAFVREGTRNYFLGISTDRTGITGRDDNITIFIFHGNIQTRTYLHRSTIDVQTGNWLSKYRRLGVERKGDDFIFTFSNWNSEVMLPQHAVTINLNDHPDLARFKGPKPYGYLNHSQADSYFLNISMVGGLIQDIVLDAVNNQVYRYRYGIGWELLSGTSIASIYGAPRTLIGQDGTYRINENGTIVKLS